MTVGGRGVGLDLDAITARCEAATPGEWETREGAVEQDDWYVKLPPEHAPRNCTTTASMARADAEFIAAARTDVELLVAEVRRLREEARYDEAAIQAAVVAALTSERMGGLDEYGVELTIAVYPDEAKATADEVIDTLRASTSVLSS